MGGRSVEEWQAVISHDEFTDWQAFYRLHPFGEKRADIRNAGLICAVLNFFGADSEIKDFIIDYTKEPETEKELWEKKQRRLRKQFELFRQQHNAFVEAEEKTHGRKRKR